MAKQYNITAIVYDKRGNVLSMGKNSYVKTHPLQAQYAERAGEPYKVFLHAELAAIIKLRDHQKPHKMVIFRYLEDGSPAKAMPCKICRQALAKTDIKIVEHT